MTRIFALLVALALATAWGCGKSDGPAGLEEDAPEPDPENVACIEEHPPQGEDAYKSDDPDCASPPPGEPEQECPPVTPEDIEDQCEINYVACDAGELISRDAALCIAEEEGLAEGIAPWRANLIFNHTHMRPVWTVDNLLAESEDGCEASGDGVMIDAETGAAIDEYSWQEVC